MSTHKTTSSAQGSIPTSQEIQEQPTMMPETAKIPPDDYRQTRTPLSPGWQHRLIEGGMVVSITLYYLIGNPNLPLGALSHLNPLYSLPLLLLFAVLCWHRLAFALALLPLTLPYYSLDYQKVLLNSFGSHGRPIALSLVEVTLAVCLVVAGLRFLFKAEDRQLWRDLPQRSGPFAVPIVLFFLLAVLSLFTAISKKAAIYAFHEEVLAPLLYLTVVLVYLRSRQDIQRLLAALIGTGCIVTIFGLLQYFIFKLPVDPEGSRVHAMYGSGNNIGTLFDYILPLTLALLLSRMHWRYRLLSLAIATPMLVVLYFSESRGAWIAAVCAFLFVLASAIRNRKIVLIGSLIFVLLVGSLLAVFNTKIWNVLTNGHTSKNGYSTLLKRPYLWQSAAQMISDSPWLGRGLDNWLCYYSKNSICDMSVYHYWVLKDPATNKPTGMQDEPTLSHPHNIFLHVWVSLGFFGLLAFIITLVFFYWLFGHIIIHLRHQSNDESELQRWMVVGVGAAMLAALVQGLVDSTFFEQDLALCFWLLVAALLLLRTSSHTPWRNSRIQDHQELP